MDLDARTQTVSAFRVSRLPRWHRLRLVLPSELRPRVNLLKVRELLPREIAGDVAAGIILLPVPPDSGRVTTVSSRDTRHVNVAAVQSTRPMML